MNLIEIQLTTPKLEDAEKICQILVEQRLVACAQIGNTISSIYQWKGKIEKDTEWPVLLKTTQSNYEAIEKIILEEHPYEVPQIIATPVLEVYQKYKDWVMENTK